jgi:hypothetical protein
VWPAYMRPDLCKSTSTPDATDLMSLECSGSVRLSQYWIYNTCDGLIMCAGLSYNLAGSGPANVGGCRTLWGPSLGRTMWRVSPVSPALCTRCRLSTARHAACASSTARRHCLSGWQPSWNWPTASSASCARSSILYVPSGDAYLAPQRKWWMSGVRELHSLVGDYRFFLSFSMMSCCATPIVLST